MAPPMPTGRTPGFLSSATRRPTIRAQYAAHGGDPFASHCVHAASYSPSSSDSAPNRVHQSLSIDGSAPLGPPGPPIFPTISSISCAVTLSGSTVGLL